MYISDLKLIRIVCAFFAIAPFKKVKKRSQKMCGLTVLLTNAMLTLFSIYWQIVHQDWISTSILFSRVFTDCWSLFIISSYVIHFRFYNERTYAVFLKTLSAFDASVGARKRAPWRFYGSELVWMNAVYFVFFAYFNCYAITTFGFFDSYTMCYRFFQFYIMMCFALFIRCEALEIKCRLNILNSLFSQVYSKEIPVNIATVGNKFGNKGDLHLGKLNYDLNFGKLSTDVHLIGVCLTRCAELFDAFNCLFGWHIFGFYLTTLLTVLAPVNMVIYFMKNVDFSGVDNTWKYMFGFVFFSTFTFILMTVAIYMACKDCHVEAELFPKNCYRCRNRLRDSAENAALKDRLKDLADEAANSTMEFNAADFFQVRYTILFGLAGSLSSYIIILIQMNNM